MGKWDRRRGENDALFSPDERSAGQSRTQAQPSPTIQWGAKTTDSWTEHHRQPLALRTTNHLVLEGAYFVG